MNRRSLITGFTALIGTAALAGCTTTSKVDGVTIVTLNVSKIKNYVGAGLSAANTLGVILSTYPDLVKYNETIKNIITVLENSANVFNIVAKNSLTVVYNDTNVKTVVDSILQGLQQLVDVIGDVAVVIARTGLPVPSNVISAIQLTRSALATITSIFRALLNTTFASNTISSTEYRALKILNV